MSHDGAEFSGNVSAEAGKLSAAISGKTTSGFFSKAMSLLAPERVSRAELTQAVTESAKQKVLANRWSDLNEIERTVLSDALSIECDAMLKRAELEDRIDAVLPEVAALPTLPGPSESGKSLDSFIYQAANIAPEVREEELRDLLARLCAGEVCRPGKYSAKTLELIKVMHPCVAQAFQRYCRLLVNGQYFLCSESLDRAKEDAGISLEDETELREAGLIDSARNLIIPSHQRPQTLVYGDRLIRLDYEVKDEPHLPKRLPLTRSHLTKCGRELYSVLAVEKNLEYFAALGWQLTQLFSNSAIVEWSMRGSDEWKTFARAPRAVVDIIQHGEEHWILARDPAQHRDNSITGELPSGRVRTIYAGFWTGSGWANRPAKAMKFASAKIATDYFIKFREEIEQCP